MYPNKITKDNIYHFLKLNISSDNPIEFLTLTQVNYIMCNYASQCTHFSHTI